MIGGAAERVVGRLRDGDGKRIAGGASGLADGNGRCRLGGRWWCHVFRKGRIVETWVVGAGWSGATYALGEDEFNGGTGE